MVEITIQQTLNNFISLLHINFLSFDINLKYRSVWVIFITLINIIENHGFSTGFMIFKINSISRKVAFRIIYNFYFP